ncbi:uncharacterized protein LOC120128345 [Hibiscus syriacus]|uniref:uncharacterized protein LOC120128345 n=1 Tax=Hibiscus syriacus TaxID=106335 RepID=UPI0019224C81|nr:uncharacterized protein LOC120128345 [Hibiscus syriacus]
METAPVVLGVIIRDVDGLILGASRRKVERIASSFAAEAVAALHAVRLSLDLGFTQVIVEGDCRSVIQSLVSSMADWSEIGIWVHEGRKLAASLRVCQFQHVPRTGNKAAYLLASFNSTSTEDQFWVEEAPHRVLVQVDEDRRLIDP